MTMVWCLILEMVGDDAMMMIVACSLQKSMGANASIVKIQSEQSRVSVEKL